MRAPSKETLVQYKALIDLMGETAIVAAESGKMGLFAELLALMPIEDRENVMTSLLTTAELDQKFIFWVNGLDIKTMTHKSGYLPQLKPNDRYSLFLSKLKTEEILTVLSAETLPNNPAGVAQGAAREGNSHLSSSSSLTTGTTATTQPEVVQGGQALLVNSRTACVRDSSINLAP